MNIHEYQAKEIFEKFGVPTPNSGVASTAEEAKEIAARIGGRGVVKAQVHAVLAIIMLECVPLPSRMSKGCVILI